jgi:hypothetical protein
MGASAGPDIVDTGLVLALDAADRNSYPGSGTAWVDLLPGPPIVVDYLVVAGGGGGSSGAGGGGGAGGLLTGSISLTSNSYSIVVGSGGTGAGSYPAGNYSPATSGGNSSFSNVIAIGGGRGGGQNDVANSGGSGGGGGGGTNAPPQQVAGIGTAGQGNSGASGVQNSRGGGGGGSGSAGSVVTGGSSTNISISGTSTAYAGGGGAGTYSITAGNGGGGGAGNGTQGISVRGGDALANTGSGGGGGGGEGASLFRTAGGGNGGSGIVIVRYPGPQRATGGTVTSVAGDTIHTFTTSGTFITNMGNNGTLVNGVGYNSGNGGSLVFDGVDDYVDLNTTLSSIVSSTLPTTWSAWVNVISSTSNRIIIGSAWANGGVHMRLTGSSHAPQDRIRFLYFTDGGNGTGFDSSSTFTSGWYNFVATYNGNGLSHSNFKFYVNGNVSLVTDPTFGTPTTIPTSQTFSVGRAGTENQAYYNSNIAQVSIYNRALTATEIQQNYNATRSRFGI